ncbi:sentrin-specific protease 2-like [Frankliniella occidentalis]|uniref:Sentrin-specific protease 2-like n=1 Tax=Frankliniella occidentalis TaxID=133901 RepID=A0A6J1T0E9_FRAOC|nr:sentrin-specific protease 2-like [Frankliniella occidentalis]
MRLPSQSVVGRPRNKTPTKSDRQNKKCDTASQSFEETNHHGSSQEPHNKSENSLVQPWEENFANPSWHKLKSLCTCSGVTLSKADFESLKAHEFLNDSIIDVFSTLIMADTENCYAEIETIPSVALQNTAIGMKCYMEDIVNSTLILNDLLIVLSNISLSHWVSFLVLTKLKCILVLDPLYSKKQSLGPNVMEHLQILRYFLASSHRFSFQGLNLDWREWQVYAPRDFLRQQNGFDCEVFISLWTYSVSCGKKLNVLATEIKCVKKNDVNGLNGLRT